MFSALSDGRINNALSLMAGHQRWVERNTGLTNDPHQDHYIQNPDGVLSNNRHFIADTQMEYQPNGDGTTEGQAIHILGYLHAYLATNNPLYLDKAIWHWDAYVKYFYRGQSIPETPQRWICNWILNSKEPCLANYPVDPKEPTHGGFKCVPLEFHNGKAQIPHGAPFWGEWLDVVTYAHRGHMTWGAINASVQTIKEDLEGAIDWQRVYDDFRLFETEEPYNPMAWIDWASYLGYPSYTVNWGGESSRGQTLPFTWMAAWTNNKIGIGRGPDDQLWDGDIIETGIPDSEIGTIQLRDTTINGVYLVNYAVRLPVELGGYMFERNECWHNRPVHTPFLGGVGQLGNAADAEVWFIDACYMLWRITGEERYKKALESVFYTAHEYTYIDSLDRFFRQSTAANTPFTDGISYDFTHPELTKIEYGRDAAGFITIHAGEASQHYLEQQSIWFRVDSNSKIRATYGGVGNSGEMVGCKVMLDVSQTKEEVPNPTWYGLDLPKSASMTPVARDIPITSLALMTNPTTNEDYIVADARAVTDYGGCTWAEAFETNVLDGRSATVINATFPDDDAGFVIGFWLTGPEVVLPTQIVYKADNDFNMRLLDADNWRWWWMLPATNGQWATVTFDPANATLSGYQPDHPDAGSETDPEPSTPNLVAVDQITILLDANTPNSHFSYYAVNDVPPLYNIPNGWTMTYRMMLSCSEPWQGRVGDCTMIDYRLDSLDYTPGVIPFSNIYSEGTEQIGAWHGMPYPGYQWPMMYCIQQDNTYDLWLKNQIDFLYDSQEEYFNQVQEMGPGCAAYIWNRWDTHKYGPPDTWTTFHWGDGKPWAGYQPRAFMAAARAWYELTLRNKAVPEKLKRYVERWITWLVAFIKKSGGHTPNEFPTAPKLPVWVPDDFTGHMCGLWLAGACYSALAGSVVAELDYLIEAAAGELMDEYDITHIPGHPMNGCWSPALRLDSDNGMAFGFYSGEIFRGLSLYVIYRKHGAGYNMFSRAALSDANDASLGPISVAIP